MKRAWFIVVGGLCVALAAYVCIYLAGTSMGKSDAPALAWLKQEYQLTDAQFALVRQLHEAYLPKCREMCRRIDEKNAELQKLLAATNVVTPEIKGALAEAARCRVDCQGAMLEHFYEVARVMPPEKGRRYLAWVHQATLLPGQMVPSEPTASASSRRP